MSVLKDYSDEELAEFMKMAISESSESDYAEAFTLLFQRHKKRVRQRCEKFAHKMGLPSSMADDMFSELFEKFCWGPSSKILKFDASKGSSRTPFLAWTMAILEKISVDMRRVRQSQEVFLSEEQWNEVCLPDEEAPSLEPLSTPEREATQVALDNLSEMHRNIVLEYYRRKPLISAQRSAKGVYDEIGKEFDTSGENVKKIISRLRKAAQLNLVPH